jgi:hypothetical protein
VPECRFFAPTGRVEFEEVEAELQKYKEDKKAKKEKKDEDEEEEDNKSHFCRYMQENSKV